MQRTASSAALGACGARMAGNGAGRAWGRNTPRPRWGRRRQWCRGGPRHRRAARRGRAHMCLPRNLSGVGRRVYG